MGQCTFDSSFAMEYTIEDPKKEAPQQGSAPLGSKGAILKKMEENKVLVLKGDSTTLSTGRKR